MSKRIVFTVTSDISFDQRMDRICSSLSRGGFQVKIIGRKTSDSLDVKSKPYRAVRFNNIFKAGKLFYLEHNVKLLFYLLFVKTDIICSIDLDTIVPGYLVSKLRSKAFVYDAHEYFPEQAQVVNRPFTKKIWTTTEKWIVPKVKYAYTVNNSLARIFEEKYQTKFDVVTNATFYRQTPKITEEKYLIYTGWVDPGRGLENLIEAAPRLKLPLMICGNGLLLEQLKSRVKELNIEDRVIFTGMIDHDKLMQNIENAYLGFLLAEKLGKSYIYALGNKFFEYVQGGIPHISIDFPEYKIMDEKHHVAKLIDNIEIDTLVNTTNELIENKALYNQLKANVQLAKKELCWEHEEQKLNDFYNSIT